MIGGEFEIDPSLLAAAPRRVDPMCAFSSGRAALFAIVRDAVDRLGVELVLLPDYLCKSMVVAIEDAGCDYAYYPIGEDLLPAMRDLRELVRGSGRRCAVVLVDYFGLTDAFADVADLKGLPAAPVLIADQSQSALRFTLPAEADYSFTTYRKSLPSPDGAPVLSRHGTLVPTSHVEAAFVAEKIEGNTIKARAEAEGLTDVAYLSHTQSAERQLDEKRFYENRMSDASATIFGHLDLDAIALRRRENFETLEGLLRPMGILPIRSPGSEQVPLFLPVLLPNRDRVRSALAERRIFCPVHWPWPGGLAVEPPRPGSRLWTDELSLVIDQRYGEVEMRLISSALEQALGSA